MIILKIAINEKHKVYFKNVNKRCVGRGPWASLPGDRNRRNENIELIKRTDHCIHN